MSSEDMSIITKLMKSVGIEFSGDDKRLPYLYWTAKLQKSPVKHRFIAGSIECTIQNSFPAVVQPEILTVINTEKYCSIKPDFHSHLLPITDAIFRQRKISQQKN